MDEKLRKRALALSVAAAVVVSSPLYKEGKIISATAKADETTKIETEKEKNDKFYKDVVEKFEKGDAYHGTGEEPFVFPSDKDKQTTTSGSSSSIFIRSRSFSSDSWRSWTSGDSGVYHYSSSSSKGGSSLS